MLGSYIDFKDKMTQRQSKGPNDPTPIKVEQVAERRSYHSDIPLHVPNA